MREAVGEAGHGVGGADRVGEGGLDPGLLVTVQGRVLQEGVEAAAEPGEGAFDRAVDALVGGDGAAAVQLDQPHGLAVVGLGEGVGERGAGVADAFGDALGAVEVAEGDVVDAVEDPGRDGGDPADGDVPFAVAGFAARHEGVGEDDGAGGGGAGGEVGADPVHGGGEHRLVPGLGGAEGVLDQGRFQIREAVEGDVAMGVGEDDGGGAALGVGTEVDARAFEEARADAEPAGRVVVAGDHDGRDADGGEPVQCPVEEFDGGERRDGPVVDVTGDEDGVHLAGLDGGHQMVEEGGLGVQQGDAVEGPAQVPVRGVQQLHATAPPVRRVVRRARPGAPRGVRRVYVAPRPVRCMSASSSTPWAAPGGP